jgi:hypothetical protein
MAVITTSLNGKRKLSHVCIALQISRKEKQIFQGIHEKVASGEAKPELGNRFSSQVSSRRQKSDRIGATEIVRDTRGISKVRS